MLRRRFLRFSAACVLPILSACLDLEALYDNDGLPKHCATLSSEDPRFVRCSGSFAKGGASTLCPAGYAPAAIPMPAALQAACKADLGGFFAVDIAYWADPASLAGSCSPGAGKLAGLAGCGSDKTTSEPGCYGWSKALTCSRGSTWICSGASLRDAVNNSPSHGVICFRP